MVNMSKDEILKIISSMSLIEIIELIDAIEKKFNIKSSDYLSNVSKKVVEEKAQKNEFDLYLNKIGQNKISVIKIVRGFLNLGLKDAKDLVESCPVLIKSKINKKEVLDLQKSLESTGAVVEVK